MPVRTGHPLMLLKLTSLPGTFFFFFLIYVSSVILRVVWICAFCLSCVIWMRLITITRVVLLVHTFIVAWIKVAEVIVILVVSREL